MFWLYICKALSGKYGSSMINSREWIRVPYINFINSTDLFGSDLSKNPYQDFNSKIISDNKYNSERIEEYYITILTIKDSEVVIFCLSDRRNYKTNQLGKNYHHSLHIKKGIFPKSNENKFRNISNGTVKMPDKYNRFIDKYPETLPPEIIRNNNMTDFQELASLIDEEKYSKGLVLFKQDHKMAAAFAMGMMPSDKVVKAIQSNVNDMVDDYLNENSIDGLDLLQAVKHRVSPSKDIMYAMKAMYPNGMQLCKNNTIKEDGKPDRVEEVECSKWAPIGKYSRMPEFLRKIIKDADKGSDKESTNIANLAKEIVLQGSNGEEIISSTDINISKELLDGDDGNLESINKVIDSYEESKKDTNKKKRGKIMKNALGAKGDSVVIRDKDDD
jgi:hypothetical protein